jgi:hypothetical protein
VPIQIAIDYGEIDAGLQAIASAGAAMASPKALKAMTDWMGRSGNAAFNLRADQVGPSISHMYEWGEVGRPDGRLWDIVWVTNGAKTTGSLAFKPSNRLKPKERWQEEHEARNEGISFGQRMWPNKAFEQETRATFRWAPGAPKRQGDTLGQGKLGPIEKTEFIVNFFHGRVVFMKRPMTVRNEYRGRMQGLWKMFWGAEFPKRITAVAPRVEKEYATIMEQEIMKEVLRARLMSKMPVPVPGRPVTVTSRRRPSGRAQTGPNPRVTAKIVGRMVARWQRAMNSSGIT